MGDFTITDDDSIPGLVLNGENWLHQIDNADQGSPLPTPFESLIPSFVSGRASVLGAETEVGKTCFGLQSFHHVVSAGFSAAYVTLEMTASDLFERFWQRFGSREACREWIREHDPYVSRSYLDAHEIEEIIQGGYDFVVIDHIHEIPFDGHEDLGRKVRRLFSLAPETNTAVLALSQMKPRNPEFTSGPPTKRDFSWTKAISESASVLMALWRPDEDSPNELELVTLKNRFGPKPLPLPLSLNSRSVALDARLSHIPFWEE